MKQFQEICEKLSLQGKGKLLELMLRSNPLGFFSFQEEELEYLEELLRYEVIEIEKESMRGFIRDFHFSSELHFSNKNHHTKIQKLLQQEPIHLCEAFLCYHFEFLIEVPSLTEFIPKDEILIKRPISKLQALKQYLLKKYEGIEAVMIRLQGYCIVLSGMGFLIKKENSDTENNFSYFLYKKIIDNFLLEKNKNNLVSFSKEKETISEISNFDLPKSDNIEKEIKEEILGQLPSDEEFIDRTPPIQAPPPIHKPPIMYSKIVNLYHEILPTLPKVLKLDEKRKRLIRNIYEKEGKEIFLQIFERVKNSPFLMGERTDFKANFDWILQNYQKILEGRYDEDRNKEIRNFFKKEDNVKLMEYLWINNYERDDIWGQGNEDEREKIKQKTQEMFDKLKIKSWNEYFELLKRYRGMT